MNERQYVNLETIDLERNNTAANTLAIISSAIAVVFIIAYAVLAFSDFLAERIFFAGFFLSVPSSVVGIVCGAISLKKKSPLFPLSLFGTVLNSIFFCICFPTFFSVMVLALKLRG